MSVAKKTVFKLGTSATPQVLVDLSTKAKKVNFPREVETKENTTFQSTGDAKTFKAGLNSATITVEFNYDTALDAQLDALRGVDNVGFEYGPETGVVASGNTKYTGNLILTKYEPPASVGELLTATAEFQVTGAVTRGTY